MEFFRGLGVFWLVCFVFGFVLYVFYFNAALYFGWAKYRNVERNTPGVFNVNKALGEDKKKKNEPLTFRYFRRWRY